MSADYIAALYRELDQMILRENLDNIFYEAAFERLIPQGKTFGIVSTEGLFSIELDTVEDFKAATDRIPAQLL